MTELGPKNPFVEADVIKNALDSLERTVGFVAQTSQDPFAGDVGKMKRTGL
ncbi:MAG: hypothetical protein KAI66_23820 [Lentisphaeria bacterium]|nr:hypothetical protein [Lentisphaeria bacterium]